MRDSSALRLAQVGLDPETMAAIGADRRRRVMRLRGVISATWRRWRGEDTARALAALGNDDLCHLSEAGQRLRLSARRKCQLLTTNRPSAESGE